MRVRFGLGVAFCMWAGSAWAQYDARPHYVVAAGGSLTIFKIATINPDCSSVGPSTINLLSAPEGGRVTLHTGRDYLAFAPNNPRSACNHRRVPSTELVYHASRGFSGLDRFSAEVVGGSGVARTRDFEVR